MPIRILTRAECRRLARYMPKPETRADRRVYMPSGLPRIGWVVDVPRAARATLRTPEGWEPARIARDASGIFVTSWVRI